MVCTKTFVIVKTLGSWVFENTYFVKEALFFPRKLKVFTNALVFYNNLWFSQKLMACP